jgi:hypothetical protein
MDSISFRNRFVVRILREGREVFSQEFSNAITDEGKNTLLETVFNAGTQYATWYCGIIKSYTVLSTSDTMASHAGWIEYTAVDEATRQEWDTSAAADEAIQNDPGAYIAYNINDATAPTLAGIFITTENTLGGTTGVLWSTGTFSSPPTVADNDVIQVQYIVEIV